MAARRPQAAPVPAAWLSASDPDAAPCKRLRANGASGGAIDGGGAQQRRPLPVPLPPPLDALGAFAWQHHHHQLQLVLPLASLSLGGGGIRHSQQHQQPSAARHAPPEPPPPPPPPSVLPVAARHHGTPQRYVWDGKRIVAVSASLLEEEERRQRHEQQQQEAAGASSSSPPHLLSPDSNAFSPAARLRDGARRLAVGLRGAFAPAPEDVSPDYWEWMRWRLSQRFFSSVVQNFATQSLLVAVGVGAKRSLAAGAVINWMLKDGVSRLVRMGVATSFGASFDSDLKRFRFATSLLFTACMSCEFAAPFFPQHFLALASVSNVGRAVGLTTFVSSQPAFMQALSAGGNLADLSAKTQAQHMAVDTAALAVAAAANWLLRHRDKARALMPVVAFPLLSAADLYCIYRELKAVELRTINRERAEMIAERWLAVKQEEARGRASSASAAALAPPPAAVPTRREVSDAESLLGPPNIADGFLPMRILPLEDVVGTPGELYGLLREYGQEAVEEQNGGGGGGCGSGARGQQQQQQQQRRRHRRQKSSSSKKDDADRCRHLLALKPGDAKPLSIDEASRMDAADSNGGPLAALRRRVAARAARLVPQSLRLAWGGGGRGLPGRGGGSCPPHLAVALAEDAQPRDVLRAVLEAGRLRRALAREAGLELPPAVGLGGGGGGGVGGDGKNDTATNDDDDEGRRAELRARAERVVASLGRAPQGSHEAERLARLRAEARRLAARDVDAFSRELEQGGWQVKPLLLSTDERRGYRLLMEE
jgi:glutamate N-acetyltransferase/amino-acid N-acetyltransferase